MHRDFLKNLKVGDQPLPKEIIDLIMAENGKDVSAALKKANAGDNGGADGKTFTQEDVNRIVSERLTKEREKVQNEGSKDTEQLQAEIDRLKGELDNQAKAHKQQLSDMAFDHTLNNAIKEAKGRDSKAVRAMLDLDALKGSGDHGAAIKAALESLQKGNGWLFDTGPVPPPYAAGTGTGFSFAGDADVANAFKPPKNY